MSKQGIATRERILDTAHDMVLQQGYAATSLDQILGKAGVTKGAFFYHFKSKEELARALFERYLEGDRQVLEQTLHRAEKLASDPLQQVLLALGFLEEMFSGLEAPHPGCLIASYCYQNELMTPETTTQGRAALAMWRDAIAAKLRAAAKLHAPRGEPDYEALGDLPNVVIEGGFVMAKIYGDPKFLARQLRQLRRLIELTFAERRPETAPRP
jgi:TetR/AcrR family transcriptional regulator, transcriptional repressor for nem operon